jgi:AraC-like DNA-binding protein
MKPRHNTLQFNSLPTCAGVIAREAYARALEARLNVTPLLKSAHLIRWQAINSHDRIPVKTQITLLNEIADQLQDPFLGIHIAEGIDLRKAGLLYYVLASSDTLGEAFRRLTRYSRINNEAIRIITCCDQKNITIKFEHLGVPRLSDRHQIECFTLLLLRACRQLTGSDLSPICIRIAHQRTKMPASIRLLFGCEVAFGSSVDEVVYAKAAMSAPTLNADPYLNTLLVEHCEEVLRDRRLRPGSWRLRVENAIAPLLPHGQAKIGEIAKRLGVGERTLGRLLAAEGSTFRGTLESLRSGLAKRYLREKLPISQIAWLLGYEDASAFSHACKRWTGKAPRRARSEWNE